MITTAVNADTAIIPPAPKPSPAPAGADGLANEQTFLKLLVAQLKNQDPMTPQDGIQFVTQLAQFSGLEQTMQMRQDLDQIQKSLSAQTQAAPSKQAGTSPLAGSK
jgi:flagellar hook assembly protein FlgD